MCDPQALKGESGRLKEKGKPMSDTPRTDAAVLDYHGMVMEENGCVPAEFARGLERELAAQQVRVQHLGRHLELAIELKRDLHSRRDAYVDYLRKRNEHLERRVAKLAALRLEALTEHHKRKDSK